MLICRAVSEKSRKYIIVNIEWIIVFISFQMASCCDLEEIFTNFILEAYFLVDISNVLAIIVTVIAWKLHLHSSMGDKLIRRIIF